MYTDQQEALRAALWNFIGAILNSSAYEGDDGKQTVVALISEELVKLCKDEDDKINMKIAKPILKSTEWLLRERANDITKLSVELEDNSLDKYAEEISQLCTSIKDYTNKL